MFVVYDVWTEQRSRDAPSRLDHSGENDLLEPLIQHFGLLSNYLDQYEMKGEGMTPQRRQDIT